MFFMILMAGGVGVDLMLNEMKRTQLQHTIDRAVLAAADLEQTLDPTAVVNDYFAKAGMAELLTGVEVDRGLDYKIVSATAESTTDTIFMNLLGVEGLTAPAAGRAEERVGQVEISMVLDISGSMRWNNKMTNMRDAGVVFLNTVLTENTQDLVSVSVVPYTAQVNAGPAIYNALNVTHRHDFSHCLEFLNSEFNTTALNTGRVWEQMQHMEWSSRSTIGPLSNPGCPRHSYERITAHSQNLSALSTQIGQLQARANTSIHLGMKWAAALLDPSFRPVANQLVTGGQMPSVFSGRPHDFDDPDTLKTIVLMTDGQNVQTNRIADIAYANPNHYYHWSRYPVWTYLNTYVPQHLRSSFTETAYTSSQADTLLQQTCTAAKDNGIIVWAIGFETSTHASNVMRNCASSPAHYFDVEGTEIVAAFQSIARQINQLKLTQ